MPKKFYKIGSNIFYEEKQSSIVDLGGRVIIFNQLDRRNYGEEQFNTKCFYRIGSSCI